MTLEEAGSEKPRPVQLREDISMSLMMGERWVKESFPKNFQGI